MVCFKLCTIFPSILVGVLAFKLIYHPEQSFKTFYYYREIAKKIDTNQDGQINPKELENWIEGNMKRYSVKNTNDRLKIWDTNNDEHISWGEYIAIFSRNNSPKKEHLKSYERRFDVRNKNTFYRISVYH